MPVIAFGNHGLLFNHLIDFTGLGYRRLQPGFDDGGPWQPVIVAFSAITPD